ncbi:hypothetical protein SBFV2_gp60 [Sulfolobales Beppu filamentous virus 2]|uniref:Uncharacterized protein n=1 Tax=Sulfolobales Beppu filamentous virus 2 TaxID=2493123 RepID=A0A3S8NEX6_9VIRU|nr:hypothetical protein HOU84_gp60 [Sulfolobales Beppu filamentous virus 2]AZI75827.1 hypothetical protein SBFV2_gp60 [Sulfolobales Beppu filamentous virus 2]
MRRTDPARIINYINSKLPRKIRFHNFKSEVMEKLREIILYNISQGKDPISFYSVRIILNFYKELAYEKLKNQMPEKALREYLDAEFQQIEKQLFDEFYKR